MVSLRAVLENLSCDVGWDSDTRTITYEAGKDSYLKVKRNLTKRF